MANSISSFYNSISYLPGLFSSDPVGSALASLSTLGRNPAADDTSTPGLIKQESGSYQVRLSSQGQIRAAFGSLKSVLDGLSSSETVSPYSATSSNPAVATATTSKDTGASGSYSIDITQLAKAQTLTSATVNNPGTTTIGTGRITIQTGTYDSENNLFTANSGSEKTVLIDASNNTSGTLNSIASAINKANAGVTATVESVSTGGYQLKITAQTGTENTLKITVSDTDTNNTDTAGLSILAYDPTAAANAGKNLTESVAAQNAEFTVNNKSYTTQSNTVTTAISNVTLKLADTGSTTLAVTRSYEDFKASVQKFVAAYNTLLAQTGESVQRAAVAGVSDGRTEKVKEALTDMNNTLEQFSSGVGGSQSTLAGIGITRRADGQLGIDGNALENAFNRNAGGAASVISGVSKKLSDIAGRVSESGPPPLAAFPPSPAFLSQAFGAGVLARPVGVSQSLFDLAAPSTLFAPGVGGFGGTGLYSFVSRL